MKAIDTRQKVLQHLPAINEYGALLGQANNFPSYAFLVFITHSDDFSINVSKSAIDDTYGLYSLSFTTGTFCIVYEYLKIFLSDGDFLPTRGKSSGRIAFPSLNIKDYNYSYNEIETALYNIAPVLLDDERTKLLDYLFGIAYRFMVAHELFHITDGHLDFIEDFHKNHPGQ